MTNVRRFVVIGALGAAAASVACHDGLLHPAAPRAASFSMAVALNRASGSSSQAFDRADGALVRFRIGDEVRLQQVLPFVPSGAETILRLDVPLRKSTETMTVDLELQSAGRPLFRGSGNATFSSGTSSTVDLSLTPVVAVTCTGPIIQFATYGRTQSLQAAAVFATGDTLLGAPISWSAPNSGVVSVDSTGVVKALGDGDADVTCASGTVSATRAVKVFAVVNTVELKPSSDSLPIGDTVSLTATLRDSGGLAITTPRQIAWSTTNAAAATVSGTGLITAVALGQAQISAKSGTATGTATITVIAAPAVTTSSATNVSATSATLNGSVNPHGAAATAWFQYGTSAALTTFSETPAQPVGTGSTSVPFAATATNLQPITTYFYRIVASSAFGNAQGSVLSFTTGGAQPSLGPTSGFIPFFTALMSTSVNPNGLLTNVWFEYSLDSALKSFSSTARHTAGNGTAFVPVGDSVNTDGLQLYFRAVAQNALGTVRSAITLTRRP